MRDSIGERMAKEKRKAKSEGLIEKGLHPFPLRLLCMPTN